MFLLMEFMFQKRKKINEDLKTTMWQLQVSISDIIHKKQLCDTEWCKDRSNKRQDGKEDVNQMNKPWEKGEGSKSGQ